MIIWKLLKNKINNIMDTRPLNLNTEVAICSEHFDNYMYFISQWMSNWKLSLIGDFNWEGKIWMFSVIIFYYIC